MKIFKNIVILGAQWGDEGKGKIVDLLSTKAQYVVRYQGGNNAGHTIIVNDRKFVLHLIPSGILHNSIVNVISGGVVISPISLEKEIRILNKSGVVTSGRILISPTCSLVLDYHVAMDLAREKKATRRQKENKLFNNNIGTTGCGIGPAYEDKVARRAIRVSDLYNENDLKRKLKDIVDYYNFQLVNFYNEESINYQIVLNKILSVSDLLVRMVVDVPKLLRKAIKKGDMIIFEGAQGSLLDIDHGTYPYVTSSNTIAGEVSVSAGVGLFCIDYILGVFKAYSTRVGFGPFPTELLNDVGNVLRTNGNEFGSTTGRSRRVGWIDTVAIRHAIKINSFYGCCLTKLDVLDGLKEINICVAYKMQNGTIISDFPHILEDFERLDPVYEVLSGWSTSTVGITDFNELPKAAQWYIKRIEEIIDVPIVIISTGPERNMKIVLSNVLNFL